MYGGSSMYGRPGGSSMYGSSYGGAYGSSYGGQYGAGAMTPYASRYGGGMGGGMGMGMGMGGMGQMGPPGMFCSSACSYQLQLCAETVVPLHGAYLRCNFNRLFMLLSAALVHAQAPGMH